MTQPSTLPAPARLRPLWWSSVAAVLFAGVVGVLVAVSGPRATLEVLRDVPGSWLAAAVVVQVLGLACLGQVYRTTHRTLGGQVSYRQGLGAALAAFALAQTLPGGGAAGGVLAARRLNQLGATPVAALHTVFHVGFTSLAALSLLLTTITGAVALATGSYVPLALVSLGVTLALGLAFAALRWFSTHPGARRRMLTLLERFNWRGRSLPARWIGEMRDRQDPLAPLPRLWLPVAWASGKWCADLVVLGVALVAAGGSFSAVVVAVSYGVANLLNNLPVTPGGVGVVEGGMAGSLMAFGLDPAVATVTTLVYRLLAYWVPLLLTAPLAALALHRARLAPPTGRDEGDPEVAA